MVSHSSQPGSPFLCSILMMLNSKVGALMGSGRPFQVGELYAHLIARPPYSTAAQRRYLVRWMREAMIKCIILKCIILNGIPIVFQALLFVAVLEREEDKDYSFSR